VSVGAHSEEKALWVVVIVWLEGQTATTALFCQKIGRGAS
jgi:hypothetical protein